MTLRARLRRLLLAGLALALAACAAAAPPPPVAAPAPAPAPTPVAPPPAPPPPEPKVTTPPPPSPVEVLAAARAEKARALEESGQLRLALLEWKVVLTVNPEDRAGLDAKKALEDRIERGVAERVGQGRAALARGDHLEARRHFLTALALDPESRAAFEALQNEVKEVRFVTHTVRARETLASIAERYYGDRSRSEVIWEMNQLPPNPRLAVGAVLRIPEIPGVPFLQPSPAGPLGGPVGAAPSEPAVREETVEMNPLLAGAKDALDKGDYVAALSDVDRLLAGGGQHPEGVEMKKAILYGLGKSQLGQRRYEQSYQTLTQLAKLAPNYQDSSALLRQARERVAQQHYSQGLRLFQEEKLEAAIAAWRVVLQYDPDHANAKRNLDQAERLLRNLQQRQQPKKK